MTAWPQSRYGQYSIHTDVGTTANERTYLGYLRTSLALSMLGVVTAQLFRIQHSVTPSTTFGYYVLGIPLASIFQIAAIFMSLLGGFRFWRQQQAMSRGKVWAGGWEIYLIMGAVGVVSLRLIVMFYSCANHNVEAAIAGVCSLGRRGR